MVFLRGEHHRDNRADRRKKDAEQFCLHTHETADLFVGVIRLGEKKFELFLLFRRPLWYRFACARGVRHYDKRIRSSRSDGSANFGI